MMSKMGEALSFSFYIYRALNSWTKTTEAPPKGSGLNSQMEIGNSHVSVTIDVLYYVLWNIHGLTQQGQSISKWLSKVQMA